MTVKKKINKDLNQLREEVILRGNTTISEMETNQKWTHVCLRIQMEAIKEIDRLIEEENLGISRTAWIRQTILKELAR